MYIGLFPVIFSNCFRELTKKKLNAPSKFRIGNKKISLMAQKLDHINCHLRFHSYRMISLVTIEFSLNMSNKNIQKKNIRKQSFQEIYCNFYANNVSFGDLDFFSAKNNFSLLLPFILNEMTGRGICISIWQNIFLNLFLSFCFK